MITPSRSSRAMRSCTGRARQAELGARATPSARAHWHAGERRAGSRNRASSSPVLTGEVPSASEAEGVCQSPSALRATSPVRTGEDNHCVGIMTVLPGESPDDRPISGVSPSLNRHCPSPCSGSILEAHNEKSHARRRRQDRHRHHRTLSATGDYKVTVADRDAASLQRMPRNNNVELRKVDIVSPEFIHEVEGHDIVLSATPFNLTSKVAEACKHVGAHYLDLTEDVESTPHHQEARGWRQDRVHSAVRAGAGLYFDRRLRPRQEVRQAARRADARRRASGVPA